MTLVWCYNALRMWMSSLYLNAHSKKMCYKPLTCCLFRSTTPHEGIPIWRPSLRHGFLFLQSQGEYKDIFVEDRHDWYQLVIPTSPETKVERMQMPRASIFASTSDTLNTINTITTPKVERKEETRASIISRPAIGINLNHHNLEKNN